jgi:hypothetical protein
VKRLTPERQVRLARILGLGFCMAGFIAIYLAWDGAARRAFIDTQFPYLLSGGMAGIGLIVFGVALFLVAQIRAERQRLTTVLDVLGDRLIRQARDALAQAAGERGPGHAEPFLFQVRYARALALVLCAAGFLAILLGWNGAARRAFVDQQFPYLISGGILGLGLLLLGIGLLLVAQIRSERRKVMNVLEVMAVAVSRAVTAQSDLEPEEMAQAAAANGFVLAGPSMYHRPECRLVKGKAGLERVTVGAARASGLSPCDVCEPVERDEAEAPETSSPAGGADQDGAPTNP